jgi:hypothetical protein
MRVGVDVQDMAEVPPVDQPTILLQSTEELGIMDQARMPGVLEVEEHKRQEVPQEVVVLPTIHPFKRQEGFCKEEMLHSMLVQAVEGFMEAEVQAQHMEVEGVEAEVLRIQPMQHLH